MSQNVHICSFQGVDTPTRKTRYEDFRAAVLRAFGVGGSRRLGELEETWDGVEGLGPTGDLGGARTIPALGILPTPK